MLNLAATASVADLSIVSLPRLCEDTDVGERDRCCIFWPVRIPVSLTWRKLPAMWLQVSSAVNNVYSVTGTPCTKL